MNRSLLVSTILLGTALAGCVQPPTGDAEDVASASTAPPVVPIDAAATLALVREYSEAFPKRNSDNEMHNAARDYLANAFEAAGLEVVRDNLTAPVSPFSTPTGLVTGGRLVNVCGILWGENRDEWIVLGGHYDITDGAIHGAYDDGSGTAMTIDLAEAFAEAAKSAPPKRTAVFCGFDGEEQGLRGSQHMAEAIAKGEWAYDGTVVAMINLDMVGIAWPAESPLWIDISSTELTTLTQELVAAVGYPEGTVEYRGITAGRSDYGSFMAIEVPTVFFISAFEDVRFSGQQYPDTYPFWHQADTYDGMVLLADGEDNLRQGFQNVLDVVSPLTARLLYDTAFVPTFDAAEE